MHSYTKGKSTETALKKLTTKKGKTKDDIRKKYAILEWWKSPILVERKSIEAGYLIAPFMDTLLWLLENIKAFMQAFADDLANIFFQCNCKFADIVCDRLNATLWII